MKTATKKLRYSKDLSEQFLYWHAEQILKAQNVTNADGEVSFGDLRSEVRKIYENCESYKQYALKEFPDKWKEFLEMKQREQEKAAQAN